MNTQDLFLAINELGEQTIEEADNGRRKVPLKKKTLLKIAAAFAAMLLLAVGVYYLSEKTYMGCDGIDLGDSVCCDGKLYYRQNTRLYCYDPEARREKIVFRGKLNADKLTVRGHRLWFTAGTDLYGVDLKTNDVQKVMPVSIASSKGIRLKGLYGENELLIESLSLPGKLEKTDYVIDPEQKSAEALDKAVDPLACQIDGAWYTLSRPENGALFFRDGEGNDLLADLRNKEGSLNGSKRYMIGDELYCVWEHGLVLYHGLFTLHERTGNLLSTGTSELIIYDVREQEATGTIWFEDLGTITGMAFDGTWLYLAEPGNGGNIRVFECRNNGTGWEIKEIGRVK